MFKLYLNLDRNGPASYLNILLLPDLPFFSFSTTFHAFFLFFVLLVERGVKGRGGGGGRDIERRVKGGREH